MAGYLLDRSCVTIQDLLPSHILDLAACFSDVHGTCLLYSGGTLDSAERSLLWLYPIESIAIYPDYWVKFKNDSIQTGRLTSDPWECLKQHINDGLQDNSPKGCWVGWLGYEMSSSALGLTLEPKQSKDSYAFHFPIAYFQRTALRCCYEHKTKNFIIDFNSSAKNQLSIEQNTIINLLLKDPLQVIRSLKVKSIQPLRTTPFSCARPLETMHDYCSKIQSIQENIRKGDVYQVNLSQKFTLKGRVDPFQLFQQLAQFSPSPFAAYFRYQDSTIVSTSPERFLKKQGQLLETRPIKGTRPRGNTFEDDRRLLEELRTSSKEISELYMITDLMRSDLGRVSLPGSVKVKEISRIETYQNVFHRLSVIEGIVGLTWHPLDILKKTFPGGSITGCPKISAVHAIHELEPYNRGLYTGSIGYMTQDGDFDFNIAIRTLLVGHDQLEMQVGGGIVIDSDPYQEYLETLYKGMSVLKCLNVSLNAICPDKIDL